MTNHDTHNRLVPGSNPGGPTKPVDSLHEEDLPIRELLQALAGPGIRRVMELKTLTNDQLFKRYDGELRLRHRSERAL